MANKLQKNEVIRYREKREKGGEKMNELQLAVNFNKKKELHEEIGMIF